MGRAAEVPPPGKNIHRGIAPNHTLGWDVVGNAALGHDPGVLPDREMPSHPHLPAKLDPVLQGRTAGQASLSTDKSVLANIRAVADLHQIVNFGSFPHPRCPHGGPINRRVCAQFDFVLQLDNTGLRLGQNGPVGQRDVAESVSANNDTALQDHAIANHHALTHDRSGMSRKVMANADFGVNHHMRKDTRIFADLHPITNHRIGADEGVLADAGRGRDDRRGMDPLGRFIPRVQPAQHLGDSQVRIVGPERGQGNGWRVGRENNRRGRVVGNWAKYFLLLTKVRSWGPASSMGLRSVIIGSVFPCSGQCRRFAISDSFIGSISR